MGNYLLNHKNFILSISYQQYAIPSEYDDIANFRRLFRKKERESESASADITAGILIDESEIILVFFLSTLPLPHRLLML